MEQWSKINFTMGRWRQSSYQILICPKWHRLMIEKRTRQNIDESYLQWKPLKAKTTWSRTNYIVSKQSLAMNSWVLSNKSAAAQTQRLKSTIGTVFRTSVNWCFVAKAQWNKLTVKQPVRVPPDSTNTTNPPELKLYFQEHNAQKATVLGIIVDEKIHPEWTVQEDAFLVSQLHRILHIRKLLVGCKIFSFWAWTYWGTMKRHHFVVLAFLNTLQFPIFV